MELGSRDEIKVACVVVITMERDWVIYKGNSNAANNKPNDLSFRMFFKG